MFTVRNCGSGGYKEDTSLPSSSNRGVGKRTPLREKIMVDMKGAVEQGSELRSQVYDAVQKRPAAQSVQPAQVEGWFICC